MGTQRKPKPYEPKRFRFANAGAFMKVKAETKAKDDKLIAEYLAYCGATRVPQPLANTPSNRQQLLAEAIRWRIHQFERDLEKRISDAVREAKERMFRPSLGGGK